MPLPPPPKPLLPRARWCNKTAAEYKKRRVQFYRMLLWRTLLDRGLNVLGVDPSVRLKRDPLPAIAVFQTRPDKQYGSSAKADVLGGTPGWFLKEYYLHTMWIRSTPATRALLRQAEARTFGVYDQTAFTEELNWGAGANATCCHTACLSAQTTSSPVVKLPKSSSATEATTCAFDAKPPDAPPPPNATRHVWARYPWRSDDYNDLKIPYHRFGRCTGRDVSCDPAASIHESCPPAPPPFTKEIAIRGKREADAARRKKKGGRRARG